MIKRIVNYFTRRRKIERLNIQKVEAGYLANYPTEQHEEMLTNLRFEVWLKQSGKKVDTIDKMKMKQGFKAGWVAKDWKLADE